MILLWRFGSMAKLLSTHHGTRIDLPQHQSARDCGAHVFFHPDRAPDKVFVPARMPMPRMVSYEFLLALLLLVVTASPHGRSQGAWD
jgi:hypothetical protein